MHRHARPRLLALLAVAALAMAIAGGVTATHALDALEAQTLQLRFDSRTAASPDEVVVVAIDEDTFSRLRQQWPFPRSLHGRAVRALHAAGAGQIVYDVQFTEPTKPREDFALFNSLRRSGGAVLVTGESDGHGATNVLGGEKNLRIAHSRAATGELVNDDDGTLTRYPRAEGGVGSVATVTAERVGSPALALSAFDSQGEALIDYRGGPGTFDTISFADVVRGRFDRSRVEGKIVVVGATTPTLHDLHPTPVGGARLMAGAEVQANAIWTALHGNPLRAAPAWLGWLLAGLLALVAPLLRLRLRILATTLIALAAAALYAVTTGLAFGGGLVLPVITPIVAALVAIVGTIVASHLHESFERRRVAHYNELLEARVRERTAELRETQLEVIARLGAAVESRDADTGVHIDRMSQMCHDLALAVGLTTADAELLLHASAMHDIGKLGIPDRILHKPGKLDPDEWEIMKTHTAVGAQILAGSKSPLLQMAEEVALTHHERWDGTGYPGGLARESIPLVGRIAAVCDVFDALISERPYKRAWSVDEALAEIERCSGSHFDPDLVPPFLALARAAFPAPADGFPADALLADAAAHQA